MFVSESHSASGSAEPLSADGSAEPPRATAQELPLERLEHEIVQLAAHINAGTCRWLELVAEFDRREGWGSWGCRSCAEWVAWRCALDPRSAREHVRVARCLDELPRIHAAFSRGHLSYSKVRALSRVATSDSEEELLELAEHATAAQLERIVRGLRRVTTDEAAEIQANRHLSLWWEDDGSLSIHGNLSPEDGALLEAALDAMHDQLRESASQPAGRPDSGSAEPSVGSGSAEPFEPRHATNADALVAMADAALASHGSEDLKRSSGTKPQVVIHIDAETLTKDAPGRCRLENGSALSPETARRLACDSSIVPLVEADGSTLSIGRKARRVPPALARALRARDGTCRFPGCENRRFGDAHHIVHWAKGGETSLDNLVWLCRRHHRLVHEGGFSVERLAGGDVTFRDTFGRRIAESSPLPAGDIGRPTRRGPSDPIDRIASGTGERLDLHHTVAVLASRLAADRG
jgi:uncharacterized protein DUF222/HNH endonuclease